MVQELIACRPYLFYDEDGIFSLQLIAYSLTQFIG